MLIIKNWRCGKFAFLESINASLNIRNLAFEILITRLAFRDQSLIFHSAKTCGINMKTSAFEAYRYAFSPIHSYVNMQIYRELDFYQIYKAYKSDRFILGTRHCNIMSFYTRFL